MLTWILVTVTAVAAIGVLALLVLREPLGEPRPVPPVAGPDDVRRGFRLVWPGYDPAEVDAHLAQIERTWSGGDDRGGGRDRLGEELEDGGGDGAGGFEG
ncbi:MAG TPA: DivIVA domain-containing protein [Egicoccus sp.]|nr:DivIVA domain-containing protein [Egicoccus sp.]HSK23425.1 DivIVA domain-containing protein [Egicoccus sp.]